MQPVKKHVSHLIILLVFSTIGSPIYLSAQSEASGLFLLISPGARAAAMGEAQVAVANDVYATYWNPAGLGFLDGSEVTGMHMRWLPGISQDIYYDFLAFYTSLGSYGRFGLHGAYLSLGEQVHTGPTGPEVLSTFHSYMWYGSLSYAYAPDRRTSLGINVKVFRQFLAPAEVMESLQDAVSTSYAFDLAYLQHHVFFYQLTFGVMLSNIGPNIKFYESSVSDPPPTTLRIGWDVELLRFQNIRAHIAYDISKPLFALKKTGQAMPVYQSFFLNWAQQSAHNQLAQLLHNFGGEVWLFDKLALRAGGFFQAAGNIHMPDKSPILTFGAGLCLAHYSFDISYISATSNHPLNNTLRVSFNAAIQ